MSCFYPLKAHKSIVDNQIYFDESKLSGLGYPLFLPCGRCLGCRIDYSRSWSVRCVHEASLYSDNCFITLTYDNDHLPEDGSLDVRHFQLFMKRLRDKFGSGIRFFHCGEYGEQFSRPHYHALLFNFDFPDKVFWRKTPSGHLFTSPSLSDLWCKGYSVIAPLTFKSAAYVARYSLKKVSGARSHKSSSSYKAFQDYYQGRKPEYATMSRRPGIASEWFKRFSSDVYPGDFVVMDGKKVRPPRYYDSLFKLLRPDSFDDIKSSRLEAAGISHSPVFYDGCSHSNVDLEVRHEQGSVREKVLNARLSSLTRVLESLHAVSNMRVASYRS